MATKDKEMKVSDIVGDSKKKVFKNSRFTFKTDTFSVECDTKFERLDPKKILPFEEYSQDLSTGKRVIGKKVGYQNGTLTYFEAIQDEKGKWIADEDKAVSPDKVEKVICDRHTGEVKKKDINKGLWYVKTAPSSILAEWLIEDTYNLWAEGDTDNMLKVYQYLTEKGIVGVMKFNPNGTAYNGFLVPQRIDGGHFRLLLQVARVRTNKPDISPTMTIASAEARAKEKTRTEQIGVASALEEVG